ncbi:M20 family metallo-hydrolase [Arthrobacter sp. NPDC058127]|uniref:M20 family metallo-hydrolase n=1 Tax=Arthrobacter sp. NPDC058127 TaxID=3346351 RepID=UPI0036DFAC0B
MDYNVLAPDRDRIASDIGELASTFVEGAQPGWTRRVFSDAYIASRAWTLSKMREAGLETRIDPAGNVVGILPGRNRSAKPLMTGSHTDTVHGGGRFDGIVGVVGAIETVRRLKETGTRLERDLVIVDFLGEEANPFGVSCVGSRSIAGLLDVEHLDRTDEDGVRLADAMVRAGLDPHEALSQAWKPGSLHGYVELHVEQGPVLEKSGAAIGVVTAIAGIERLLATFTGRADHAGTMPMDMRHDALAAAAASVVVVEREGCGAPVHGVSTVGRIESGPGSFNVVPDNARFWAEMRSTEADWLTGAKRRVAESIGIEASNRGVDLVVEWLNDQAPVRAHEKIQDTIARAADDLSFDWEAIPSGAGHDAAHLAHLGPMGMIFVPSISGRSHCPEEKSDFAQIAQGVHVLTTTLLHMDRTPAVRPSA